MTYSVNYTLKILEFQPLATQGIEENALPQLENLKATRRAKKRSHYDRDRVQQSIFLAINN